MDLGKAIAKIRGEKKLNQDELALKMGITPTYLSMVENGKRKPSTTFLDKFSYAIGVPTQFIFWAAMTENDVHYSKRENYKILKPAIDALIKELT